LAPENNAAFLPGHCITPVLPASFAEMLGSLEAFADHESQAEALEIESRELLEGEHVRRTGPDGLRGG
jgi:hypothetical protein